MAVLPAKPKLTLTLGLPIALANPNPNPNPQPSTLNLQLSQSSRFSTLPLCAKHTKATMMAMSYVLQLLLTPGTLLAFICPLYLAPHNLSWQPLTHDLAIHFNKEVSLCATYSCPCPRSVSLPGRLSVCACVSARSLSVCLSDSSLAYAMARAPRWSLKGVCL